MQAGISATCHGYFSDAYQLSAVSLPQESCIDAI